MNRLLNEEDARDMLRALCAEAGSMRKWAEAHNITPTVISDTLAGRRPVSKELARRMGLTRIQFYARIEAQESEAV